ncbi:MAG: SsrA-binding protein SmpB, partial [Candidatus Hydrogenedens sp.]
MLRHSGEKLIVQNRRAHFDYEIFERYEAGISLKGTEVKSLRTSGSMSIQDAYVDYEGGELFLVNAYIRPYEQGNILNHDPHRERKLLLHKREIIRLGKRIEEKGLTLIPLRVYFKN